LEMLSITASAFLMGSKRASMSFWIPSLIAFRSWTGSPLLLSSPSFFSSVGSFGPSPVPPPPQATRVVSARMEVRKEAQRMRRR